MKTFSNPKLYIPKKNSPKGRIPDLSGQWYVYFFAFDPRIGKINYKKQWKFYQQLNTFKTISERKRYAELMIQELLEHLSNGYNPYIQGSADKVPENAATKMLNQALNDKRPSLQLNTYKNYAGYLSRFLSYLQDKGYQNADIALIDRKTMSAYMNHLGQSGNSPVSVDNARRALSALFDKLEQDLHIESNPLRHIKPLKSKPLKNEPFSPEELARIQEHCRLKDPLLYHYLRFIYYSFLRPREIVQLRAHHIHLESRTLSIRTKTEARATVYLVDPLMDYLNSLDLSRPEAFVITKTGSPGPWKASEKGKIAFFSKRFQEVRKTLDLPHHKNTYSLRHNAAKDLYQHFIAAGASEHEAVGQLMQITRHKDSGALRAYLRDIGAVIPRDWSGKYNFDF